LNLPPQTVPSQWPTSGAFGPASTYCASAHATNPAFQGNQNDITLAPGTNGPIAVSGGTAFHFPTPGDYFVDSISTGNGNTIDAVAGVRLFVCGKVDFNKINGTPTNATYIETQFTDSEDALAVSAGTWVGDMIAPNGGIHYGAVGSQGAIVGHVWAKWVDIEHSVDISVPNTTTTTTSSTA